MIKPDNIVSSFDKPITIIKKVNTSVVGYEETFREELIHSGYANIYIQNGNMAYSQSGASVQIIAKITFRDFSRGDELDYDCIIQNGVNKFKPTYIEKEKGIFKILSTSWVEE